MENTLQGIGSFIPIRFLVSEKMTEELDPTAQDSDGGSEEVVLTPAELIERLEQVRINNGGYFTELLWGLNEMIYVKHLVYCLTQD